MVYVYATWTGIMCTTYSPTTCSIYVMLWTGTNGSIWFGTIVML